MIYTVTAWQRRASSHLSGSSHAHISTDCKCSSVPLFSTEFTCQEGFARFHRLGPEPLPTPPAARAKLLGVPPPRHPGSAAPYSQPPSCLHHLPPSCPNLPLQLTSARWETQVCRVHSKKPPTCIAAFPSALCTGLWVLVGHQGNLVGSQD